jgi:hypothetical protein
MKYPPLLLKYTFVTDTVLLSFLCVCVAEVGKLKIVYLRHIPLPTTQQVADIAYLLKKGRIERITLFSLDFWEGRGRRYDGFLL